MPAATSPVDICNLALDELKQAPIQSITTPKTDAEYICARNYDNVRREALMAHPFKFAIKRIQLSPNATKTPPFGYLYAYDLPVDYIRMVSVGDDYIGDLRGEREIEDNCLLAVSGDVIFDGSTKNVRYIYDVVDVTKFSPLFVTYLRLKLAVRMSNKFSVTQAIKKGLKEDFRDCETEARAVNGQENRIKRIQFSRTLTKRRGLPGGIYASKYTVFGS
jgi:hypothetical protein